MIKGLEKRSMVKHERNWDYSAQRREDWGQIVAGVPVYEGLVHGGWWPAALRVHQE